MTPLHRPLPTAVDALHDVWQPTPYVVAVRRRESADVYSLGLRPQGGGPAMAFQPGQFNMLYGFGVGEAAISISGDPAASARSRMLWHTIRIVGGVTSTLSHLRRGDSLLIRGPFGRGWPINTLTGRDLLIVAGGIGLAPLRPVLLHIRRHRRQFGRVVLIYGARTPADLLFTRDLAPLSRADIHVERTVDHGTPDWHGDVGVVTAILRHQRIADPRRTSALLCGPEIMMRYARDDLRRIGLSDDDIHVTMERNMACAVGHCGRCQLGPHFICKDGPVFPFARVARVFDRREL